MSYLNSLRLHFAGRFRADVSTINNHPDHYDNQAFDRSRHWQPGVGGSPEHGWWRPKGSNRFAFSDVSIRSAYMSDGAAVDRTVDSLFTCELQSRGRVQAKLVDLDPDQQLVSMIFGLQLALIDDSGRTLLEGEFEPAPFTDLWRRGQSGGGDEAACAFYQSILKIASWGDLSGSPFLQQLQASATSNILSIKFNVDGYSMNSSSPGFTTGRVTGTIGPTTAVEPKHWVIGRHLGNEVFPLGSATPGFRPTTGVNYSVAVHDTARNKIRLDLGNALPVNPAGGAVPDLNRLILAARQDDGSILEIADIPYQEVDWYESTAGVTEIPEDRALTPDETQIIANSSLCIIREVNGQKSLITLEPNTHVRADAFVARLNPGQPFVARMHASSRGKPLANATIRLGLVLPSDPQAQMNFPVGGLQFPNSVVCDANGNADVEFIAADPGNPRFFYRETTPRTHVDGQVYLVGYELTVDGVRMPTANPSDFFSVLVWNDYVAESPPTWHGSMKELFAQYANLYPWMFESGPQIDLAEYEDVSAAREDIIRTMELDVNDQAYMPVSRDLSSSRKVAMLNWLHNVGADRKPLLGAEPPVAASAAQMVPSIPMGSLSGVPSDTPKLTTRMGRFKSYEIEPEEGQ